MPLTYEWIKKYTHVHTHTPHTVEYYLFFKRKKILQYATTWMKWINSGDPIKEINLSQKDKSCIIPLL